MKYKKIEIFPTSILLVHVGDEITQEDRELMVRSVDELYEKDLWDKDTSKPRFQTFAVLFKDSAPPVWHKLRQTFIEACNLYIKTVEDVVPNKDNLKIDHVRAWCYKSSRETIPDDRNPMHSHRPSFLSGVFYLKIPDGEHTVGTEFGDPLGISFGKTRDVIVTNSEFCWTIFPGHLPHRACQIDTIESRYVIAADCFVSLT